jgi:hypothetical protein
MINKLNMVFGGCCDSTDALNPIHAMVTKNNWNICMADAPFIKIYIAATEPRQLWPIINMGE